jgi:PAS domain S-box-containing protein
MAERQLIERAQLLDLASDAIMVVGKDDVIRYWNNGAYRLYGWSREEAVGRKVCELLEPVLPYSADRIREELSLHKVWHGEIRHARRDGGRIIVDSRWTLHQLPNRPSVYLQINTDVTEKKRLQAQLLQAQKMEAIGRLTGGIAHDFNNLLTIIMGRVGLVLERSTDEKIQADLELVLKTASRAAGLTRHLLAFSRQQVLEPRVIERI